MIQKQLNGMCRKLKLVQCTCILYKAVFALLCDMIDISGVYLKNYWVVTQEPQKWSEILTRSIITNGGYRASVETVGILMKLLVLEEGSTRVSESHCKVLLSKKVKEKLRILWDFMRIPSVSTSSNQVSHWCK